MGKNTAHKLGTYGGIKYLQDEKRDPEAEERNERDRIRAADPITNTLTDLFGDMGIGISRKQFAVSHSGLIDQDITFERCYQSRKLLVQTFSTHINMADQREDVVTADEVKRYSEFAHAQGYAFLPIIDSEISRDDVERVQREMKVAA